MSAAKYPSWEPAYQKRYRAEHREQINARQRNEYAKNPAPIKARNKAYYERNRQAAIDRSKQWRINNHERYKAWRRARYHAPDGRLKAKHFGYHKTRMATGKDAAYRERTRESHRAWSRARSFNITDGYARELLSKYSPVSAKDWPQELVDVKKIELKLKRACNNGRTLAKSQN